MNKQIEFQIITEKYEEACIYIASFFCQKYFNDAEYYWVGNQIGGVLEVCDMYFSVEDMFDYVKYKYTFKQMCNHYEYALERHTKGEAVTNIKSYKYTFKKK